VSRASCSGEAAVTAQQARPEQLLAAVHVPTVLTASPDRRTFILTAAAIGSTNASVTHCSWEVGACNARWIAGRLTDTVVTGM
jgi:hypothetical protein